MLVKFRTATSRVFHLYQEARKLALISADDDPPPARLSLPETRILALLLDEPGRVRERGELVEHAWQKRPVTAGSLNQAILNLRKAFGRGDGEVVIQTVPQQGYRILASVDEIVAELEVVPDTDELLEETVEDSVAEVREVKRFPLLVTFVVVAIILNAAWVEFFYKRLAGLSVEALDEVDYVDYPVGSKTLYSVQRSLQKAPNFVQSALLAFEANPPQFLNNMPAKKVYVNHPLVERRFSYFVCNGDIEKDDTECTSYKLWR